MTETKRSKIFTHEQLEAILNTDHIWQHLVKTGYINKRGDVIEKRPSRRRSLKRHVSNDKQYSQTSSNQSSSTGLIYAQPIQTTSSSNDQKPQKSVNYSSLNQRPKSASAVQSKQTNKTPQLSPFSSATQSTFIENVLIRRAVSPKILPHDKRCFITMKYFGELITIDFNRSLFIPQDDEVMVMQQHCGGENLIVFKGLLKPNDSFSFQSRRHTDYPFALGFYINGVIVNRLSVCCEARFKKEVQVGGKRGIFSIISVEKPYPCRRCRFEQHLEKLFAAKPELIPKKKQRDTSIKRRPKSRESSTSRKDKTKTGPSNTQRPKEKILYPSSSKPSEATNQTSKTNESSELPPNPKESYDDSFDTNVSSSSSSQKVEIGTVNGTKTNDESLKDPELIESDKNDSKTSGSPTLSSKPVEPDTKLEPRTTRSPETSPTIVESEKQNPPEIVESPIPSSGTTRLQNKNITRTVAPRLPTPEPVESDTSSSEDRRRSPIPIRARPTTAPVNQLPTSNSPSSYPADFDVPDDDNNSTISSSREESRFQPSQSNATKDEKNKTNNLDNVSIISSEHEDEDDTSTSED